MDQKKEEILENHGKNLPHGQSIGDRPVDHHDLPPMMTKAQLGATSGAPEATSPSEPSV